MALRTPPSWLQNGSHPAENDRLTTQALWKTTGIINATDLAVTQNSPAGMSVLVAAGWAAILGTTQTNMGVYMAYNDASAVATITTANVSNPRIDIICITVSDAYYTGALNQVAINVVAGTAAASPVAPATPANSILLATIAVGTGVTSILTANITDSRSVATNSIPASAAAAGTLTGATLASNVLASSLTSFGTTPVIASPKISSTYTAKTAAYTFASGDEGNTFSMNNAATQQFNIPTDATFNFAVGTEINVFWITGAGQPTIGAVTPGTTTVISTGATSATPKLRVANSGATCKKLAANSWIVFGDLA
jgi:hypothetical protein